MAYLKYCLQLSILIIAIGVIVAPPTPPKHRGPIDAIRDKFAGRTKAEGIAHRSGAPQTPAKAAHQPAHTPKAANGAPPASPKKDHVQHPPPTAAATHQHDGKCKNGSTPKHFDIIVRVMTPTNPGADHHKTAHGHDTHHVMYNTGYQLSSCDGHDENTVEEFMSASKLSSTELHEVLGAKVSLNKPLLTFLNKTGKDGKKCEGNLFDCLKSIDPQDGVNNLGKKFDIHGKPFEVDVPVLEIKLGKEENVQKGKHDKPEATVPFIIMYATTKLTDDATGLYDKTGEVVFLTGGTMKTTELDKKHQEIKELKEEMHKNRAQLHAALGSEPHFNSDFFFLTPFGHEGEVECKDEHHESLYHCYEATIKKSGGELHKFAVKIDGHVLNVPVLSVVPDTKGKNKKPNHNNEGQSGTPKAGHTSEASEGTHDHTHNNHPKAVVHNTAPVETAQVETAPAVPVDAPVEPAVEQTQAEPEVGDAGVVVEEGQKLEEEVDAVETRPEEPVEAGIVEDQRDEDTPVVTNEAGVDVVGGNSSAAAADERKLEESAPAVEEGVVGGTVEDGADAKLAETVADRVEEGGEVAKDAVDVEDGGVREPEVVPPVGTPEAVETAGKDVGDDDVDAAKPAETPEKVV